jgi:uncharacterized repeat protein (TIGR03847 family)
MPGQEIILDPVDHVTTDAIGAPGQRVFYIQATKGTRIVTLIVEKFQIQTLAVGVERFLTEIGEKNPQLEAAPLVYDEDRMHIQPPVDPLFRAGELGLSYDAERDMVALIIREALSGDKAPEDAQVVQLFCTRAQIRAMSSWGLEVADRGRPICPYCGEPMDPESHFCPKKNGHKH